MEAQQRELTILLTVAGMAFPDRDRLLHWLECTALDPEAVKTYLPGGVAFWLREIVSNLPEDAPYLVLEEPEEGREGGE